MYNPWVQQTCVIGVDLGGTNVRAGAYFADGSPAGPKFSNPSCAQEGTEQILSAIKATIRQAVQSAQVEPLGVGIAVPGVTDDAAGIVRWAPNFGYSEDGIFHFWENQPLREPLFESIGLPIHLGNDANLAALGEYLFGTGRGNAKCLVMLTVGTGIGGGVVLSPDSVLGDARGPLVLLGGNKGGGELGYLMVQQGGMDANAGCYGSLEGYCRRDAIIQRAVYRIKRGRESRVTELVSGDLGSITPLHLAQAADQGDEMAIEVWEEVGQALGVGIAVCVNIFAPDVLAIGGQIAKAGEWLIGPARKAARNIAIPTLFNDAVIVQAEQIEDAGMLGGAALALESLKWKNA